MPIVVREAMTKSRRSRHSVGLLDMTEPLPMRESTFPTILYTSIVNLDDILPPGGVAL